MRIVYFISQDITSFDALRNKGQLAIWDCKKVLFEIYLFIKKRKVIK